MKQLFFTLACLLSILIGQAATNQTTYEATAFADLADGDVVAIVDTNGKCAIPNANTGSVEGKVTFQKVTLNSDNTVVTADDMSKFLFTVSKIDDSVTFKSNASTDADPWYLYCTAANKGVHVGTTTTSNVFTFRNGFLNTKVGSNTRYIGVYETTDWRCYTSIHDNIKATKTAFYKQVVKEDKPTCETPVFKVNGVDLDPNAIMEVDPGQDVEIYCPTEKATIESLTIGGVSVSVLGTEEKYTFRIYDDIEVVVKYKNGEAISEPANAMFVLKNFEGGDFIKTPLSQFKGGDQVVLVRQTQLRDMSSVPTTGSAKANTVTLSDDKNTIVSKLTNAEVFTVEKNDDGTISLRSNVLSDSPLYLQYGGSGTSINIAPLADAAGDLHKFVVKTTDVVFGADNPVYVLSYGDYAIRYVDDGSWDARQITSFNETNYASFYCKPAPVAKAAVPTFNPAGGAVTAGTTVTVSTATEGAKLDLYIGDDLVEGAASPYIFTVNATVDVMATAYNVDVTGNKIVATESETATTSYTIKSEPVSSNVFKVATSIEPYKNYIVVAEKSGKKVAMGSYDSSGHYYNEVAADNNFTVEGDIITLSEGSTAVAKVVFEPTSTDDEYHVVFNQGDTEGYIVTSTSKNKVGFSPNEPLAASVKVANDGKGEIIFTGSSQYKYFRHNSSASRFSCYNSATSVQDFYLYVEVVDDNGVKAPTFTPAGGDVPYNSKVTVSTTDGAKLDVKVGDVLYEGVESPFTFNVTASVIVEATAYKLDTEGKKIISDPVETSFNPIIDPPVADSNGGVITGTTVVTLTTDQEGAIINWQLDNGTSGSGTSPVEVTVDGTATLTCWTTLKVGETEYTSEVKTLSFILQEVSTWRLADHVIPGRRFFLVGVNTTMTPPVYFATHGHTASHSNNIGAVDASATTFEPVDDGNSINKYITVYDAKLPYLMLEKAETTETSGQSDLYKLRYCDPMNSEQVQYLTNASSGSTNNRLWVTDGTNPDKQVHNVTVAFDKDKRSVRIQFVGGSSHNSIAFHFGSANGNLFSSYASSTPAHFEGTASETEDIFWPFLYVDAEWLEAPTITPVSGTSVSQSTDGTIAPNAENPNSTIYYQINDGEVLSGQPGETITFTINGDTKVNYWAEETITDSEGNEKTLESEHLTATYTYTGAEPKVYHRSHKIRENVDYVFVGMNNSDNAAYNGAYLMTQHMTDKNAFGALKAGTNFSLTDDKLQAIVSTTTATVINFRKSGDNWNMIEKSSGKHIARGLSGEATLGDVEDAVSHKLHHETDHYQTHFEYVEQGDAKAQLFGFYAHADNSKFGSYETTDAGNNSASPIYLYASEVDPVAKENIKFRNDAETMNSTEESIVTGYDWTTGEPVTVNGTTTQVDDGYIYVYYDLASTIEQAQSSPVNNGVLKYGNATYGSPEASANYANEAQTSPVKLHVEVELLGNKYGDYSSYKKPNPDIPGGWDDQIYLKYYGVNQTRIHDVDAPYVKVPITSRYSVVRATAQGDGTTHTGTADADIHVYSYPNGSTTGVEGVEAGSDSDAEVKYYNLQGVRISRPSNGVYIRVEGNRVSKVRVF